MYPYLKYDYADLGQSENRQQNVHFQCSFIQFVGEGPGFMDGE